MPTRSPAAPQGYDIIHKSITEYLRGVRRSAGFDTAMRQAADEYVSPERARYQLQMFLKSLPWELEDLKGKRILDIGSNAGTVISFLNEDLQADAYGVEPQWSSCMGARYTWQTLQDNSLLSCAVGENLPFKSGIFDLVLSFNVMEHVQDPERVMQEGWRVLKPGGYWFSTHPNYGSFWEGHYAIPWIPFLSKPMGRAYVRLWGRRPDFVDDLQLLTVPQLRRAIAKLPGAEVVTWGDQLFLERLVEMEFVELSGMEGLKRLVGLLRRVGIASLAGRVGNLLNLFTPISLTVRKHPVIRTGSSFSNLGSG